MERRRLREGQGHMSRMPRCRKRDENGRRAARRLKEEEEARGVGVGMW